MGYNAIEIKHMNKLTEINHKRMNENLECKLLQSNIYYNKLMQKNYILW